MFCLGWVLCSVVIVLDLFFVGCLSMWKCVLVVFSSLYSVLKMGELFMVFWSRWVGVLMCVD